MIPLLYQTISVLQIPFQYCISFTYIPGVVRVSFFLIWINNSEFSCTLPINNNNE